MAKSTLKHQFFNSIDRAFAPGVKKHSYEGNNNLIYSYQYRENLRDTASEFSKFIKENYDLKQVKDIRQEHAQTFLNEKSKTCSIATVEQYKSRLSTLSKLCNNNYGIKTDFSERLKCNEVVRNEKQRCSAVSNVDYKLLLNQIEQGRECDSKYAVQLASTFGLRVSEVTKMEYQDIHDTYIHIHKSKGGRSRDLHIRTEEQREILAILKYRKDSYKADDKILKVQSDSVNKYLKDNFERIGIDKYTKEKTGVHALRKRYATNRYKELKGQGKTHAEAWGEVSVELGHSYDRGKLYDTYIDKEQL